MSTRMDQYGWGWLETLTQTTNTIVVFSVVLTNVDEKHNLKHDNFSLLQFGHLTDLMWFFFFRILIIYCSFPALLYLIRPFFSCHECLISNFKREYCLLKHFAGTRHLERALSMLGKISECLSLKWSPSSFLCQTFRELKQKVTLAFTTDFSLGY